MGLLYVLAAMAGFGTSGFLDKLVSNRTSQEKIITLVIVLTDLPITIIASILCWHYSQTMPNPKTITWAAFSAIGIVFGLLSFFRAMEKSESGTIVGVTSCYPVVPIVIYSLWGVFYKGVFVGVILIALGVALINRSSKNTTTALDKTILRDAFLAIGGFALSGMGDAMAMDASKNDQLSVFCLVQGFSIIIVALYLWASHDSKPDSDNSPYHDSHLWGWCAMTNITYAIGLASYLTAMTVLPRVAAITATSGYPVVTFILGVLFLQERFSWTRLAGIIFIICGTALATITAG